MPEICITVWTFASQLFGKKLCGTVQMPTLKPAPSYLRAWEASVRFLPSMQLLAQQKTMTRCAVTCMPELYTMQPWAHQRSVLSPLRLFPTHQECALLLLRKTQLHESGTLTSFETSHIHNLTQG